MSYNTLPCQVHVIAACCVIVEAKDDRGYRDERRDSRGGGGSVSGDSGWLSRSWRDRKRSAADSPERRVSSDDKKRRQSDADDRQRYG